MIDLGEAVSKMASVNPAFKNFAKVFDGISFGVKSITFELVLTIVDLLSWQKLAHFLTLEKITRLWPAEPINCCNSLKSSIIEISILSSSADPSIAAFSFFTDSDIGGIMTNGILFFILFFFSSNLSMKLIISS